MSGKQHVIQDSFSAGAISPLANSRTDIATISSGAKELVNMLVLPQGPATSRLGTTYVAELDTGDSKIRAIKLQPNIREGFILVFSDLKVEIFEAKTRSLLATEVMPYTTDEVRQMKFTPSVDTLFITQENHPPAYIIRESNSTWNYVVPELSDGPFLALTDEQKFTTLQVTSQDYQLQLVSAGAFAGVSVGEYIDYKQDGIHFLGEVLTVVSNDEVIIRPENFIASGLATNAIFLVDSPNSRLLCSKLTFTTTLENTWARIVDSADDIVKWVELGKMIGVIDGSESNWNWDQDAGGIPDNSDAINMITDPVVYTVAPDSTVITEFVNTSEIQSDVSGTFNAATDVGRQIRITVENRPVWGEITTVVSDTEIVANLNGFIPRDADLSQFSNNGKTTNWNLGAFYEGNYPRANGFVQDRWSVGGTPNNPEDFWCSVTSQYFNFAFSDIDNQVNDNSALGFTLPGDELNSIQWFKTGKVLVIGTEGSEWILFGSVAGGALTPVSAKVEFQSANGSTIAPVDMQGVTLFYQTSGRKLRELDYNDDKNRYDSTDISVLAENLLRDNTYVIGMERAREPFPLIFSTRVDGSFLVTTYTGTGAPVAFTDHFLGGGGKVLDIAVARHEDTTHDEAWFVVEREINGETRRYLEVLKLEFFPNFAQDKTNMNFLDSHTQITIPTPLNMGDKIFGFDHLIGETVTPVINGSAEPNQVVAADGSITSARRILLGDTIDVKVGYNFRAYIHFNFPEYARNSGSIQGRIKRIDKLNVNFFETLGISYGWTLDKLDLASFRATSDPMDQSPDFANGYRPFNLAQGYSQEGDFYLVQDQPYPFTALQTVIEVIATQ